MDNHLTTHDSSMPLRFLSASLSQIGSSGGGSPQPVVRDLQRSAWLGAGRRGEEGERAGRLIVFHSHLAERHVAVFHNSPSTRFPCS
ncbi:hypothetical protein NEUTE2DRAFT_52102 [Neurospora tetrasperma FGSC 2509]|nr:hypothetical protein NEUTE2DRAFT_52102 [Neurospora tetrasperma FGSC 2509]